MCYKLIHINIRIWLYHTLHRTFGYITHYIIDEYCASHKIFICDDFNGTLLSMRSNTHDRIDLNVLRAFSEKNSLTDSLENSAKCTFFLHSGKSYSQIDYILTKSNSGRMVSSVDIYDIKDINTSLHVPVTMSTNQSVSKTVRDSEHSQVNQGIKKTTVGQNR